jgi:hypothetical protein
MHLILPIDGGNSGCIVQMPLTVCTTSDTSGGWTCADGFTCACTAPSGVEISTWLPPPEFRGCFREEIGAAAGAGAPPGYNGRPTLPVFGFLGFSQFGLAALTAFTVCRKECIWSRFYGNIVNAKSLFWKQITSRSED